MQINNRNYQQSFGGLGAKLKNLMGSSVAPPSLKLDRPSFGKGHLSGYGNSPVSLCHKYGLAENDSFSLCSKNRDDTLGILEPIRPKENYHMS